MKEYYVFYHSEPWDCGDWGECLSVFKTKKEAYTFIEGLAEKSLSDADMSPESVTHSENRVTIDWFDGFEEWYIHEF